MSNNNNDNNKYICIEINKKQYTHTHLFHKVIRSFTHLFNLIYYYFGPMFFYNASKQARTNKTPFAESVKRYLLRILSVNRKTVSDN